MIIRRLKSLMILSGIWKENSQKKSSLKKMQLCYLRSNQGHVVMYSILTFIKFIQLLIISADMKIIYMCFSMLVSTLGIVIRLIICEKFNTSKLIKEIIKEEKEIRESSDNELIETYERETKICIVLKNIYIIAISVLTVGFAAAKSTNYLMNNKTGPKSQKELIETSFLSPIWFPFKEAENLLLSAIINISCFVACATVYVSIEVVLCALIIFASVQLKLLQLRIRNLDSTDGNHISHYNALRELVIKHNLVVNFVKLLNGFTKYIILTNFLISSVNIASTAIMALVHQTIGDLLYSLVYVLILVLNVFITAWFTNEIKIQNHALGEALYQTKWYKRDLRYQKLLLFMLQQTQQPLTLSIGPFGPMTTETALRTMQTAYSYLTVMMNLK